MVLEDSPTWLSTIGSIMDGEEDTLGVEDVEVIEINSDADTLPYVPSDNDDEDDFDEILISQPIRDDAQLVFSKHKGSVFCLHVSKEGNLVVTGGEDDTAFVWDCSTGNVLFECTGHKASDDYSIHKLDYSFVSGRNQDIPTHLSTIKYDSVVAAEFNHDDIYVATGDMSGLIRVWKIADHSLVWSEDVSAPSASTWFKWHHGTNALMCSAHNGEVYLWKIPSGQLKVIPGHATHSTCGLFMADGRRSVIGYSDGCTKLFDLTTEKLMGKNESSGSVESIDVSPDNNLIVSACSSVNVTFMKCQMKQMVTLFDWKLSGEHEDWVEAVGFCPNPCISLAAFATLSGNLYIFDYSKQLLRHKCELGSGITCFEWDSTGSLIYAGCMNGAICIVDARGGIIHSHFLGHCHNVLDLKLTKDGSKLLSVSDDCTARVFSINDPVSGISTALPYLLLPQGVIATGICYHDYPI